MRCLQTIFIVALELAIVGDARSQVTKIESDRGEQPVAYKMLVSPASEPRPALKYHFLVPPVDQVKDNAATFYYKSMVFESPDWIRDLGSEHLSDKIDEWTEMPLDQLPQKEILEQVRLLSDETWLQANCAKQHVAIIAIGAIPSAKTA